MKIAVAVPEHRHRDPRIHQVTKAATELLRRGENGRVDEVLGFEDSVIAKAGSTTIEGSGPIIISAATGFDTAMAEYSAFFAILDDSGFQRLPFRTRVVTLGDDATAAVIGQGKGFPVQEGDLRGKFLEPKKAGGAIVISNDLIKANDNLESFVSRTLRAALGKAVDTAVFDQLADGLTPVADLGAALDVVNHGAASSLRVVVEPTIANEIALADPTGQFSPSQGGIHRGLRTYVSAGVSGTIVLDARRIGAHPGNVAMRRSDAGVMQLNDPLTMDSLTPTAGSVVSMFQADCTALLAIVEFGVEALRGDAVAVFGASSP